MADGERPTYAVLGATGGIGSELASQLAGTGARVAVAGRREDAVENLAGRINGRGWAFDAGDGEAVRDFVRAAAEWGGGLAGVVNCIGSILLKPAHLTSLEEFDEVVATNLRTAFATVRAAAGVLKHAGGSIVLVSTGAAGIGLSNHEAIASAKAGVEGLVRAAAATYAAHDVRVNAVAPGLVATPLTQRITENEVARKASTALHPLGRIGQPGDVARAIAWLLDPANGWVTGQVLGVDGGLATLKTRARA